MAGRLIFPIQIIRKPGKYINQTSYYPECQLKSKKRIFFDQIIYCIKTGEINKYYFLYGFDKKSKKDYNNYISTNTFSFKRNRKNQQTPKPVYDSYNYICLLRDKFLFEAFCQRIGLNTPENIGMIQAGKLYLLKEKSFISLDNIKNFEGNNFLKRNVYYGGGLTKDIMKLKIASGKIFINNEEVDTGKLKEIIGTDTWIIQKSIEDQDQFYANFHPQSINTIRIVTVNTGSSIEVLFANFRMGANGRNADNWSSGGILVNINIENGTLRKWGFYKPGTGTKCDRHPNSEIVFDGLKLKSWEKIVEYAKKTHTIFYGIHSVGWDICLTSNGPMLIEGNDNWGPVNTQTYKGAREIYEKFFK